ncbi:hypothetical protein [Nonomuraea jabiensis]|uniref:Uncharacterized protein n=1 Tax=Nonomuraea jabiensis TaxID=882448 RepID=A0A7W9GEU2_9ACTN|nr:hypothetical protein [Nonomuraea jabiensis]MBB5782507.1 hypothetical protein [Nonomuraea jabiensis]
MSNSKKYSLNRLTSPTGDSTPCARVSNRSASAASPSSSSAGGLPGERAAAEAGRPLVGERPAARRNPFWPNHPASGW